MVSAAKQILYALGKVFKKLFHTFTWCDSMFISEKVWHTQLRNGETLASRVGKRDPDVAMIIDKRSVLGSWEHNLVDAEGLNNVKLIEQARRVISFLKMYGTAEIYLIGWLDLNPKVGGLFAIETQDICLIGDWLESSGDG